MIEITNLRHTTQNGLILEIESLRIEAGEVTAIIGAADSGLETIFALLTGQVSPAQGQIQIGGQDPRQDRAYFVSKVGILFAEEGLYKNQTAEENLLFECRLRQIEKTRALEVLTSVGLNDQRTSLVNRLSPSQQRRLAFSRAILHAPDYLLLVEPFQRCDEYSIEVLSQLMRQITTQGVVVLIFSSERTRLNDLCDRMVTLSQGKLFEIEKASQPDSTVRPFKIPVKLEDRVALINPADILYAEAAGDSAQIQTMTERLPTQYTLNELENRLKKSGFFRSHRAYLVNLQHVREVIPFTRNSFSLRLDDEKGTILPLSKTAAGELKELLDY